MRKTTARGGASRGAVDSGHLKETGGDGGTGEALEEHGGGGERT